MWNWVTQPQNLRLAWRRVASNRGAMTTVSAEMKWTNGWSAAGTFEGEFSNVTRSYAGTGVVRGSLIRHIV